MTKDMICIACPIGCRLTAQWEEGGEPAISGNQCRRGEEYGREEILSPSRVVTATVSVLGGVRVPIKSTRPVPRQLIPGLLDELYRLDVKAPVGMGDVVLGNYRDLGIDIVTTGSASGRS